MTESDIRRIESHLKRTFNTGGIQVKARPKQGDSAEVYVGDEFIGVVFKDEDEDGSFMFEMATTGSVATQLFDMLCVD